MIRRYFLEVSYRGNAYAGFQVQQNAHTVQDEVERALEVFFRKKIALTGSSRTDAGVHARQNYFHFDFDGDVEERNLYNINSILPPDIALNSIREVGTGAHCRFDAVYRQYKYLVYTRKDPFTADYGYYFPYKVDLEAMRRAADCVKEYDHFEAFSKRNTQVKTYRCMIMESRWDECDGYYAYCVRANRFLRGMVRGLVGTMLQVGRGKIDVEGFRNVVEGKGGWRADFAVPGHGLCLEEVGYPQGYFGVQGGLSEKNI